MLNITASEIRSVIYEEINNLLIENGLTVKSLQDGNNLNSDLGLSSLDLARLIAVLEMRFNADPFAEFISITSIKNIGALVKAYNDFFTDSLNQKQHHADLLEIVAKTHAKRNMHREK